MRVSAVHRVLLDRNEIRGDLRRLGHVAHRADQTEPDHVIGKRRRAQRHPDGRVRRADIRFYVELRIRRGIGILLRRDRDVQRTEIEHLVFEIDGFCAAVESVVVHAFQRSRLQRDDFGEMHLHVLAVKDRIVIAFGGIGYFRTRHQFQGIGRIGRHVVGEFDDAVVAVLPGQFDVLLGDVRHRVGGVARTVSVPILPLFERGRAFAVVLVSGKRDRARFARMGTVVAFLNRAARAVARFRRQKTGSSDAVEQDPAFVADNDGSPDAARVFAYRSVGKPDDREIPVFLFGALGNVRCDRGAFHRDLHALFESADGVRLYFLFLAVHNDGSERTDRGRAVRGQRMLARMERFIGEIDVQFLFGLRRAVYGTNAVHNIVHD